VTHGLHGEAILRDGGVIELCGCVVGFVGKRDLGTLDSWIKARVKIELADADEE